MVTEKLMATDHFDPAGSVVDNASRLVDAASLRLAQGGPLVVSFAGTRGVSSTYFNVILQSLVRAVGRTALESRVSFEFDSDAQRMIFQRSMDSVRRLAS